ncbi:Abi-alpha family protein [Ruegeria atlantica]|uniref:Abi-alpha family protein n=1 Tax=Ruegeria atlantica TaxID=81569 RepID=UPI00147AEC6B|nr:Abi-alpha family protein [Ruegeria atlantica]
MPSDDDTKPKVSVDVTIGKQIDAALGDVIRGLLQKPSEEAGNLLADGIGILGDRVKRKRLLNTQLGLEETRGALEERGIELKDITPPLEEDLHVLLDGMSVSADEKVRALWSGLLASALDPNKSQSIDRPLVSAISSLSPADARIIEYVAFVVKNNRAIQQDATKAAGLEGKKWLTYGDVDRVKKERQAMGPRLITFMEDTSRMAAEFELQEITTADDWSDNLRRVGVIRPKPEEYTPITDAPSFSSMDVHGGHISELLKFVEERVSEAESLSLEGLEIDFLVSRNEDEQEVSLGIELTRFGEKLCQACGLL